MYLGYIGGHPVYDEYEFYKNNFKPDAICILLNLTIYLCYL